APLAIAIIWFCFEKKRSFASKCPWVRPLLAIALAFTVTRAVMSLNEIGARNAQAFANLLRTKQTFPHQVDDTTWIDAVDADGAKVVLSYSFAAIDQEEASRIMDEMRRQLPSKACSDPGMRLAVSQGVTLDFHYRMRNGPSYDPIVIVPKDCTL